MTANGAVREMYERHVDDVYRYVARRLGAEPATDITADTFRIALQRFESFDGALGNERAWLSALSPPARSHASRAPVARGRAVRCERIPADDQETTSCAMNDSTNS